MRMMIFLKTNDFVLFAILCILLSIKSEARIVEADMFCIKLSKKYEYFETLNIKVNNLIEKNMVLIKKTPSKRVTTINKLKFILLRLGYEQARLKKKLLVAEIDLVKKKCPSYDILSRFEY